MIYNYKNPLSITSQFSFCGMPFRLDTYSGCSFNCIYCYSHKRGGNSEFDKIKIADPDRIIKTFENALNKPTITTGLVSQYIRRKMPIHFGGMSDPFQHAEEKIGVSYKVLKYLCSIEYPVVISTKSTLIASEKYLSLLKGNRNVIVQYSFSTLNKVNSKFLEPNCDAPFKRLEAIKILSNSGVNTTIRLQPFIVGLTESPVDFVSAISETGVKHLTIEFLKLPIDNTTAWHQSLKPLAPTKDFYLKQNSKVIGRELTLLPKLKLEIIRELKNELSKHKISLGIGDNELQHFSDTLCCCGIDQFIGFENWNTCQFSYALKKTIGNKLHFDIIKNEWSPDGAIDKHLNSKSRIKKTDGINTVSSYLTDRWNKINSDFNPSKYYGVKYSGNKDENGFCIFEIENDLKGL